MDPVGRAHRAATRALKGFRHLPEPVREELAQEAAVKAWRAPDLRDPAGFAAQQARWLAIDWTRRERRRPDPPSAELAPHAELLSWERRVDAFLDLQRVRSLIAVAPALHRETLVQLCLEERRIDDVIDPATSPRERDRQRDLLYKRRNRARSWIRCSLQAPPPRHRG